jgi:hypothetical protein
MPSWKAAEVGKATYRLRCEMLAPKLRAFIDVAKKTLKSFE